eukprot:s2060_g6.t1
MFVLQKQSLFLVASHGERFSMRSISYVRCVNFSFMVMTSSCKHWCNNFAALSWDFLGVPSPCTVLLENCCRKPPLKEIGHQSAQNLWQKRACEANPGNTLYRKKRRKNPSKRCKKGASRDLCFDLFL